MEYTYFTDSYVSIHTSKFLTVRNKFCFINYIEYAIILSVSIKLTACYWLYGTVRFHYTGQCVTTIQDSVPSTIANQGYVATAEQ